MAQVHYLYDNVIEDQMYNWLSKKGSKNTRIAYEKNVRQFFEIVRDKDMKVLNGADLEITLSEIDKYQQKMLEQGISGKTINTKLGTVKGFLNHLNKRSDDHGIKVSVKCFDDADKLQEDTEHHDTFEYNEYLEVAEWVKDNELHGEAKKSMIRFTISTGARLQECLNLKWTDFVEKGDKVIVTYKAKGNVTMVKEISKEFYQELRSLPTAIGEKVFPFHNTTIQRMMDNVRKEFRFLDNRKIVYHSFRKTAGTFVYNHTGDINAARLFLGHANINTTQIYLKQREYGHVDAVSLENKADKDFYKTLTHEQLIEVIQTLKDGQNLTINKLAMDMFGK